MKSIFNKLRIGEKIGLSFGFVGLLFLGVIWQYNETLRRSLADYQSLQEVFGAKKSYALEIRGSMMSARQAEEDFLIHRNERFAHDLSGHVDRVLKQVARLEKVDGQDTQTTGQIAALIQTYHQRFLAIFEAWRTKGLDHNSGLQGAFRDSVHELESLAGHFKVDALYLQLLQIRRGEKDLGLRREKQYRNRVFGLVGEFRAIVESSGLDTELKAQLQREISTYLATFGTYADNVLGQKDIHGGKGPFRQAAHRIEALLNSHYVPDLERNILQLRRREKDYLLRGDKQYVDMALLELKKIHTQLNGSGIAQADKEQLTILLDKYKRDFLALVEQNGRINGMMAEMREAVLQVAQLVAGNVEDADREMRAATQRIHASSDSDARVMLWIASLATLLGVFFSVIFSLRITRPVLQMAGLLDRLAYDESVERIPTIRGGRDEINAMAESVNTMADHKAHFISWWKASMQETEGYHDMRVASGEMEPDTSAPVVPLETARENLEEARKTKGVLLSDMHHKIQGFTHRIVDDSERLLCGKHSAQDEEYLKTIAHSGKSVLSILRVILGNERKETGKSD